MADTVVFPTILVLEDTVVFLTRFELGFVSGFTNKIKSWRYSGCHTRLVLGDMFS